MQQKLLYEILDPRIYKTLDEYNSVYKEEIELVYANSISSCESIQDLFSNTHLIYFEDLNNYGYIESEFQNIYYYIKLDLTALSDYEFYFIEDFLCPFKLEFFGHTDGIQATRSGGRVLTLHWWFKMQTFMIEYDEITPEMFMQVSEDIYRILNLVGTEMIHYAQDNWQNSYDITPQELNDYLSLRKLPLTENSLDALKEIRGDKIKISKNKERHQDLFYERVFTLIEKYRQGERHYR